MEQNTNQPQPISSVPTSTLGGSNVPKPLLIIVAIVVIVIAGYFTYQKVYTPWHEAKITEEIKKAEDIKILGLEQKIIDAKGGFVSLSSEEYDLLLSRPVTTPGVEGITTTTKGITVGFDGSDIHVAFPYIPNVEDSEKVFVRFNSILTKDNKEVFDKESSFEDENDIFTDLDLEKRSSGTKAFWLGSRDPSLLEDIEVDQVGYVSGNVIFAVPVNGSSIKLSKADVGVEKPFAGGFITLNEIKEDSINFKFTGNKDAIYTYSAYDVEGKQIERSGYSISNKEYEIYFDNAMTVEVIAAEIEEKSYPFTIGVSNNPPQVASPVTNVEETSDSKQENKKIESLPITADEKAQAQASMLRFVSLFKTTDIEGIKQYMRDANLVDQLKELPTDQQKLKEEIAMAYDMLFKDITADTFKDSKVVWIKDVYVDGQEYIDVEGVSGNVLGIPATCTHSFDKVNSKWYWVDVNCE